MIAYRLVTQQHIRMGRAMVRIHDCWKKCVVFLGREGSPNTRPDLRGTGFLVSHEDYTYLVTAKHVAKQVESAPAYVCLNDLKGAAADILEERLQWVHHPNDLVDVSATPIILSEEVDFWRFPSTHFATDEKIAEKNLGPGDLANIIGLFRVVPGKERNMPIVHTGHVAMLPEESIPVRDMGEVEAYLVETKSPLDGLSGSPVFARKTVAVLKDPEAISGIEPKAYGAPWLLGVWQSDWEFPAETVLGPRKEVLAGALVPLGMGVVVPANRILEILNDSRLAEKRQSARNQQIERNGATMRSTTPPKKPNIVPDNPTHQEDFTRLLDEAAKEKKSTEET